MGGTCYLCDRKFGIMNGSGFDKKLLVKNNKIPPKDMTDNDIMCGQCYAKDIGEQEREQELLKQPSGESSVNSPMGISGNTPTITKTKKISLPEIPSLHLSNFTSAEQLRAMTKSLHDQTKANWEKNGVVQYKDEGLVILQRMWGQQVQFIVACAQITKEGYRLMAIDEGKEGSSGGFSGGVNAYFYFQKMDYIR